MIRMAFCALMFSATAFAAPDPSACDVLDPTETSPNVNFENVIQPIFSAKCGSCHLPNQSGGLSLAVGASFTGLVGVPAVGDGTILRVARGDAAGSLLFRKVNCQTPGVGSRMPLNRNPLTALEQRSIRDWINQLPIFANGFE